jgi:hypothetical protein
MATPAAVTASGLGSIHNEAKRIIERRAAFIGGPLFFCSGFGVAPGMNTE